MNYNQIVMEAHHKIGMSDEEYQMHCEAFGSIVIDEAIEKHIEFQATEKQNKTKPIETQENGKHQ